VLFKALNAEQFGANRRLGFSLALLQDLAGVGA